MEEINIKQINKEVKQLEKNFLKLLAINKRTMEDIEKLKREIELLVQVNKESALLMKSNMFLSTNTILPDKALSADELSELFSMGHTTTVEICKTKGSPAFKKGDGATSQWMCFAKDFLNFQQMRSKQWKG